MQLDEDLCNPRPDRNRVPRNEHTAAYKNDLLVRKSQKKIETLKNKRNRRRKNIETCIQSDANTECIVFSSTRYPAITPCDDVMTDVEWILVDHPVTDGVVKRILSFIY